MKYKAEYTKTRESDGAYCGRVEFSFNSFKDLDIPENDGYTYQLYSLIDNATNKGYMDYEAFLFDTDKESYYRYMLIELPKRIEQGKKQVKEIAYKVDVWESTIEKYKGLLVNVNKGE